MSNSPTDRSWLPPLPEDMSLPLASPLTSSVPSFVARSVSFWLLRSVWITCKCDSSVAEAWMAAGGEGGGEQSGNIIDCDGCDEKAATGTTHRSISSRCVALITERCERPGRDAFLAQLHAPR
eukprot:2888838-Prymnesium_polylepis.2